MATATMEIFKLLKEEVGEEKAEKLVEVIEESIETVRKEAKAQKPILKAEIIEELRKELATKEDVLLVREELLGEMGKLDQKIETVRQEMKTLEERLMGEIKVLKILIYVTLLVVILMNKGTIEYIVNLIKMVK